MALRSDYKGIKKLASGLKWNRPGILAADGTALAKVFFTRSEQAVLGAKNLLPNNWSWEDTGTLDGITLTRNSDDTITVGAGTVSGGGGKWLFNTTLANLGIKKGRYKVTANIPSSLGGNVFFTIKDNTGNVTYNVTGSTQEVEIEVTDVNINHTWHIYTWFNNNTVISESFVMQPMIRLASDTDNTFASHAMTNEQLTKVAGVVSNLDMSKGISSSGAYTDLNNVKTSGMYAVFGSATNKPADITTIINGTLIVTHKTSLDDVTQTLINGNEGTIYVRSYATATGWSSWYKFTGTVVS